MSEVSQEKQPTPLKKEFVSVWLPETVFADVPKMTLDRAPFFESSRFGQSTEVILPSNIAYLDLVGFVGKRTKITIEEIPW